MISTLFFIFLPLLCAALLHHFIVIPLNLFSYFASPIDSGFMLGGKPLLGKTKTWRGLLLMTMATSFFAWLLSFIISEQTSLLRMTPWLAGAICGLCYSLGELPTSFIKRRVGLASSDQRYDVLGNMLYVIEQADSITAVVIAVLLIVDIDTVPVAVILGSGLLGIALHIFIDLSLYKLGYKRSVNKPKIWHAITKPTTSSSIK